MDYRRETRNRVTTKRGAIQRLRNRVALWSILAIAMSALSVDIVLAQSAIRRLATSGEVASLDVVLNRAETIEVQKEVSEILVGNPEIADVVALSDRSIYVLGKKIGSTSVSVVDRDRNVIAVVGVKVTSDIAALKARLATHLPQSRIDVVEGNGKVLLSGIVPNSVALSRALAIGEQFAPGAITNGLAVRGSQQVLLEVRFIEANRDSSRDLGVAWDVFKNNGNLGIFTGLTGLASNNSPFGVAVARLLDSGTKVDVIIQALEKRGLARRLAEPNLVALSGDTASFLAGGEFPFPVQSTAVNGQNQITVEFKKFGVGLAFTPTVLANGLINLKIEPEVSELDPTTTLRVGDIEIPSISVRRARTTIELRDGQSFAMAGLLQANTISNKNQIPWLGQVPVLGPLLRSAAYSRKETDLVIIVTPRLVKPRKPGDAPLRTPLDGKVAANDVEFFVGGREEIKVGKPDPKSGHILDLTPGEPVKIGSLKGK